MLENLNKHCGIPWCVSASRQNFMRRYFSISSSNRNLKYTINCRGILNWNCVWICFPWRVSNDRPIDVFWVHFQELCAALGVAGTDDDALIRVITTRAELDMQYIKLEFTNESKRTLEEMIANDTTGNYRYFLLTLVGPGDLGLNSPRTSNASASFYSPRTSNGSAPRPPSTGSQNGSVSYYSPRSSTQGSFQM